MIARTNAILYGSAPSGTYAAGVLLSTVADLIHWDAALCTDTLLPLDWFAQMWQADASLTFSVCYNLDNGGSPPLLINDLAALFLPALDSAPGS